jgi:protein tyrosine/serine phosphatase
MTKHEIPNFQIVDKGIARGGQPNSYGWLWLYTHGYTNIIKLNTDKEGNEYNATTFKGVKVHHYPIDMIHQLVLWVDKKELQKIVSKIKPGTFIYCTHGQDRTGLVVGCYRLKQGYTKEQAFKEMKALGFHQSLQSLLGRWNSVQPKDFKKR